MWAPGGKRAAAAGAAEAADQASLIESGTPSALITSKPRCRVAAILGGGAILLFCLLTWSTIRSFDAPSRTRESAPESPDTVVSLLSVSKNTAWGSTTSARERLSSVMELLTVNPGFENVDLTRCALVGSGDILEGEGRGKEIDGHSLVIRMNRIPTPEFFDDFGQRSDIVLINIKRNVKTMGEGKDVSCADPDSGCHQSGILFGGMGLCGRERDFSSSHSFVGCYLNDTQTFIETALHSNQPNCGKKCGKNWPSCGFGAALVFASVCDQLDVYGFGGKKDPRSTADGHREEEVHHIEDEHAIEAAMSSGSCDRIKQEGIMGQWWWTHAGIVNFVGA
jgi:hypothetical protein